MMALVSHPAVVRCEDFSVVQYEDEGTWEIFIRMELLMPLTAWTRKNPVTQEWVRQIGASMAQLLQLCEERKIMHRDIKPANVFIDPLGNAKLGDFGLARQLAANSSTHSHGVGTDAYMAPEVAMGEHYDTRADIYSLGLLLYWLLNERRGPFLPLPPAMPLAAEQDEARSRRFRGEPLPPPAHGSSALKRVVLSACAFEPEARYQTAEALSAALEAAMRGQYLPPAGRVKPGEDGPACGGFDLFAFGEEEEDDVSAIAPRRFLKASARTEGETVPGGLIFSPGEIDERETSVLPPDQRQILPPDAPGGDTLRADDTLRVTQPGGTYDGPTLTD
jgi:serine/threonine protein kinase